jgi:hypothetical protein
MRIQMLAATAATALLFGASAALAQTAPPAAAPANSTRTIDNDRVSGTVTTTRDAGTINRATELTRKSDGATATANQTRTRTETGVTASSTRTGFDGQTSSSNYARTRTETGATETGSFTRRDGSTLNLTGSVVRGDGSMTANRAITDSAGATVASRNVQATRAANGQVTRNVTATGPQRLLTRAGRPGAGRPPVRRAPQG